MANGERCRYCGAAVSPGMRFCKPCLHDKFSEVYLMFGITNGWDSKPREHVKVESGWRGRQVVGMKTAMRKHSD